MKLIQYAIIFSYLYVLSVQVPQIFHEVETCKTTYKSGKKTFSKTIPSFITAENSEIALLLTICGKIPKVYVNDGTCKNLCMYDKRTRKLIHPKNPQTAIFEITESSQEELVFQFQGQLKCTDDQNYDIKVRMVSSSSMTKPRLNNDNPCDLELEMLKPDYEPPCTHVIGPGQMIDFRPLRSRSLTIPFEGEKFVISLCGFSRECGIEATACKIGNDTFIFGSSKNIRVSYDNQKDKLKVISTAVKTWGKPPKMEVTVNCNWKVPYLANGKYFKPQIQGRTYTFSVDSSFACIKMPVSCIVLNKIGDQYTYDLRSLYRKEGYKVPIGSKKYIHLNICGDLIVQGTKGNDCDLGRSQACEISGNTFVNKGSVISYEVTREHFVRAHFKHGNICNGTDTYSTEIDIKCSTIEKPPVFVAQEGCVMKLAWNTTKACPKIEREANDCVLNTLLGNINLSGLHSTDSIQNYRTNERLQYNICGDLHGNCSTFSNVTACFIRNGQQKIVGWNSPQLSYSNGNIQLKYFGEQCQGDKPFSFTINLFCTFAENVKKEPVKKLDDCTFSVNIQSKAACFLHDTVNCTWSNDKTSFDLTPLIAKDENYKIIDPQNRNITYLLNVCAPLISGPDSLTPSNTMVSMINQSTPHLYYKFSSLGKIAGPIIRDGNLLISANLGQICEPGIDYTSIIHFECSQPHRNGYPEFLRKNGCVHEFLWKTSHACPKTRSHCMKTIDDFEFKVPDEPIDIEINPLGYTFNLCSDNYKICVNESCSIESLSRSYWTEGNNSINVELYLEKSVDCTNTPKLSRINVTVECDPNVESSLHGGTIGDCQMEMILKTKLICKNGKENMKEQSIIDKKETEGASGYVVHTYNKTEPKVLSNDSKIPAYESNDSEKTKVDVQIIPISGTSIEVNKSVINGEESDKVENNENKGKNEFYKKKNDSLNQKCYIGEDKFSLENIKSPEILANEKYTLNFDKSFENCKGLICKNGEVILSYNDECPHVTFEDASIKLSYSTLDSCTAKSRSYRSLVSFNIDITLRCNQTSQKTSIMHEDECKMKFETYSPEFCKLFTPAKRINEYLLITGIFIIILALGCSIFVMYKKNYCRRCSYTPVKESETPISIHFKLS